MWRAEGAARDRWAHTSQVVWAMFESTRPIRQVFVTDKIPVLTPKDFNPFEAKDHRKSRQQPGLTISEWNKAMIPKLKRS